PLPETVACAATAPNSTRPQQAVTMEALTVVLKNFAERLVVRRVCVIMMCSFVAYPCASVRSSPDTLAVCLHRRAASHRLLGGSSSYFWQFNRQSAVAVTPGQNGRCPQSPLAQSAPG